MTNTKVFNIKVNGNYPSESYQAVPITLDPNNLPLDFLSNTWASQNGGQLITRSYLNYHKNPLNSVLNYSDFYYSQVLNYSNATFSKYSDIPKYSVQLNSNISTSIRYIEPVDVVTLNESSTINFNIATLRQNLKTPYEFYFNYVQLNDTTLNSYGYFIYPSKIFLQPTSLTNNGGKWQLTTRVKLLSSSEYHIQSTDIERDAYFAHLNRLQTLPSDIIELPSSALTNNLIKFDLYASRTYVDKTIISTISPHISINIDDYSDVYNVNPDSTFIAYNLYFKSNPASSNLSRIEQTQRDLSYYYNSQAFSPTYVERYNQVTLKQTFQLLQAPLENSQLDATTNCVLSATVNNKTGLIDFYNYYTPASISLVPNTVISFDAIIDSVNLSNVEEVALSTLTNSNLTINASPTPIANYLIAGDVVNNDIVWETDYPPYCYSYKLTLSGTNQTYKDSNSLNWYLKLSASDQTANSVSLNSYIACDFNVIKIPVDDDDLIQYTLVASAPLSAHDLAPLLSCTYDNGLPCDLSNPQPIQALIGRKLNISYTGDAFSGVTFSIRASLTTASGTLDSYQTGDVTLVPDLNTGNKIVLDNFNEIANSITADSSFNINASAWPSRDLRNSQILWSHTRNDLSLSFNYVDANNNYISPVRGATIFNDKTWYVNLSGYGAEQVVISLSSQKYNEIATLSSHPLLYNFLSEGKLSVGPISKLDNLNITRSIKLSAAIPYHGRFINIPTTVPINWTWQYDGISDAQYQPITLNSLSNSALKYVYGTNIKPQILSAIKLNITPGYSKTSPKFHKVKAIATIDAVYPPISGSYSFLVDDFPDPSIFNCDFQTYYTDFNDLAKYQISNTRNGDKSVTRSELHNLNFTLSANNDIISKLRDVKLKWSIDNVFTSLTGDRFDIQLGNPLSSLSSVKLNGLSLSTINIQLSLDSTYAPGWTSAHNVSANTRFYILSSTDFYNELKFILFPKYAWLGPDTTHVTILSTDPNETNYFTNSYRPSAYNNTKSNTLPFWLSANKTCFEEYIYQNKRNYSIVSTTTAFDLLEIPYTRLDYTTIAGVPISLVGYNKTFYPENINLSYLIEMPTASVSGQKVIAENGLNSLVTEYYSISTSTINGAPSAEVYNNFFLSPIIKDYSDITFNYTVSADGIESTFFNLDSGGLISIQQYLDTSPPNLPSIIMDGTITYFLSTKYWEVSSVVPVTNNEMGVSSTYDLFKLQVGDPALPLYSGDLGKDDLFLYAVPVFNQQITYKTFDNYLGTNDYPVNPNLWDSIEISTATTYVPPNI
jgi:hypothetical protein